jgi:hypothetical protein
MELGRRRVAGKRIGDHQVGIYKKLRTKLGQEVAAAKAGISGRSARRLDGTDTLPSQRATRAWRTRADPFEAVWQSEVVPLLEAAPALTATTLLEEMQRRHPGQYDDALLRTLQRRVRTWGASHGREREVFFAQAHPPGRLGLSDFTHAAVLQVTIAGAVLLHLLYQFALAYSGWRYVEVVLGGESFMALSSGLQNAVWMMGGVLEEHRTDSLTAAYNNHAEHELLTRRYESLCVHYGMRPSRNNLGVSHENGSIESRQGTLKRTMEQALLLRGHRDFADLDAYRRFVAEVFGRLNARVAGKFSEERRTLRALPARRSSDYEEVDARVTKYGTMTVKKVLYTAPSRLVGQQFRLGVLGMAQLIAPLAHGGTALQQAVHGAHRGDVTSFVEQLGVDGGRRAIGEARAVEHVERNAPLHLRQRQWRAPAGDVGGPGRQQTNIARGAVAIQGAAWQAQGAARSGHADLAG